MGILGKDIVSFLIDTVRKLNVYKTFRRCPERLRNVLCTFSLIHVSTGLLVYGSDRPYFKQKQKTDITKCWSTFFFNLLFADFSNKKKRNKT